MGRVFGALLKAAAVAGPVAGIALCASEPNVGGTVVAAFLGMCLGLVASEWKQVFPW